MRPHETLLANPHKYHTPRIPGLSATSSVAHGIALIRRCSDPSLLLRDRHSIASSLDKAINRNLPKMKVEELVTTLGPMMDEDMVDEYYPAFVLGV